MLSQVFYTESCIESVASEEPLARE